MAGILAVGMLTACGSTVAGEPTRSGLPAESSVTTPAAPSTTPPESPFVERTREIPLDDLNPCDVWTKEQLAELDVGPEPSRGDPEPDMFGNLGCSYGNHPPSEPRPDVEINYGAYTNLRSDVEGHLIGHQPRNTPSVVEVAGFPAVQLAQPPGALDACDVYIGTAEGQTLRIYFEIFPNELTVEESCLRVMRAAELAMATVQSLR